MLMKWLPWRWLIRALARRHGFLDPIHLLSRLHLFAQPSEVGEPIELLRAGVLFHARGLMNTRAIQHNLDWVWPFWVERQFDPRNPAFVPRAFSVTHVNLTHRNWTAVGLPDCPALPIVDPRGLVTPHWDGWSLDAWVLTDDGRELIPSRAAGADQRLDLRHGIAIETATAAQGMALDERVLVASEADTPSLRIRWTARSNTLGWLAVVLRPYNPEGVSFIHDVKLTELAWTVDGKHRVEFSEETDHHRFSDYRRGDVHIRIPEDSDERSVRCDVGLATAAALYRLVPGHEREISAAVPLTDTDEKVPRTWRHETWASALEKTCAFTVPDERMRFLYDAAVRTLVLHSPGEVFPGPYTYKRFWFRDAAFIIDGLIAAGLIARAERALDRFPVLQRLDGYFLSQEGEWDSNGEALWILDRFCRATGRPPKHEWLPAIRKAAEWIRRKRLPSGSAHPGLMPPGFSAEHLGLNDYYYWDDFWGVAGLRAAASLLEASERETSGSTTTREASRVEEYRREADDFSRAIETSLAQLFERRDLEAARQGTSRRNPADAYPRAVPAAPGRRMDTGAIGSIAAGYPLRLWPAEDPRLRDSVSYLMDRCFEFGGFFQDMIHSGINAYLTLHVAQVLLRAGDARCADLMRTVAGLATSTGQWPEAIHPATRGGCMGDGQHAWAAAEWVLYLRNAFVREEADGLIIGSGIPDEWLSDEGARFGPTPTSFGEISIRARRTANGVRVEWTWESRRATPKRFEVARLGQHPVPADPDAEFHEVSA
jgi:hypothetical protein